MTRRPQSGPSVADLRAMMVMEPEKAIAYLERKGFSITWDWHEADAAAHARAFTVAKATSLDVLKDLRDGMKGRSLRQYQKELEPVLRAKGWWGKKEVLDGDTGEVTKVQLGSPRRLQTIYQTNMQSAYMAGRYADAVEAADTHPYAMYIAVMDASTRPSHAALNGRVFRLDDPVWQHICPPNGYGCRCRFITLTEAEIKRRGLVVESSAGKLGTVQVATHRDPDTGDTQFQNVTTVRMASRDGSTTAFRPDVGFDGGPAASHLMDDVLYRKAQAALSDRQLQEDIQSVLLAPVRMKAWQAFVHRLQAGSAVGPAQTFGVGVMQQKELARAGAEGLSVKSGIIHVSDRQLAGAGLSAAESMALPARLAKPERVLWDKAERKFVYVLPSDAGRVSKLLVRVNRFQTGAVHTDDAASVHKAGAADVQAGIRSGRYEKVR